MPRRHGKKEDKSEDVYEIKSILAYEKRDGEDYYHIEWDGYPLSEATWEPRSNFFDPQAAIVKRMNELKEQHESHSVLTPSSRTAASKARYSANGTTPTTKSEKQTFATKRKRASITETSGKKKREITPSSPAVQAAEKSGSAGELERNESPVSGKYQSTTDISLGSPRVERLRVKSIKKSGEQLEATLVSEDGEKVVASLHEARKKYPQELIDFLVSRIQFRGSPRYDSP